jgi:hypothetical protein
MEQIFVLMVDLGQNPIFVPLLTTELEALASSWSISNDLALLTFAYLGEINSLGSNLKDMDFFFLSLIQLLLLLSNSTIY